MWAQLRSPRCPHSPPPPPPPPHHRHLGNIPRISHLVNSTNPVADDLTTDEQMCSM